VFLVNSRFIQLQITIKFALFRSYGVNLQSSFNILFSKVIMHSHKTTGVGYTIKILTAALLFTLIKFIATFFWIFIHIIIINRLLFFENNSRL